MIRRLLATVIGAVLIAAAACGPAVADSVYHEHNETDSYTIDIAYPLEFPDRATVSDFVSAERQRFLDWVDRFGSADRSLPNTLHISPQTYQSAQPNTTTLVLSIDNDTGYAHEGHPATSFRSFPVDLATQTPITFDRLFESDAEVLAALTPRVRASYDAPGLELLASDCRTFAITDDAVIFFFGEGQLMPSDNTGPRVITVPRSELAPLTA